MRKLAILTRSIRHSLPVAALLATASWSPAATVIWDADPATSGLQDVGGTAIWKEGNNNWFDDLITTNVPWSNAEENYVTFGYAESPNAVARLVTVDGTVNVNRMTFKRFQNAPNLGTNAAFSFTGGTIQLAPQATIQIDDGATASNALLTFDSVMAGSDVSIQRTGAATQFVALTNAANTWTGTLTLETGLFVRSSKGGALSSLDAVDVREGSTLSLVSVNQTYLNDFIIAGTGADNRGALRIDDGTTAQPTTLEGQIVLSNHATVSLQNSSGASSIAISKGGITDVNGAWNFTKTGAGTLIMQGASNYRGMTIVSPLGTANPGILRLDFAGATVTDNLLYNGVTANTLKLTGLTTSVGSVNGTAVLEVNGKADTTVSQTFGGMIAEGYTAIRVANASVSGVASGTVNLNLGTVSRNGAGAYLKITGPTSGSVTASNASLIGPWATYTNSTGTGWAGTGGGVLGLFDGDVDYGTGTNVTGSPTLNLRVSGTSTGDVLFGVGTTALNTVSMTDTTAARTLALGSGQTLQLGQASGFQIFKDPDAANSIYTQNLTIGTAPNQGTIITGTTAGAELFFANFSNNGQLRVNSQITDNAVGTVHVTVSGPGRTILAGSNSYTGLTLVQSGVLEVRNSSALGTGAGQTEIATDAAVQLSGNLTLNEGFILNGSGLSAGGALRNLSGTSTINSAITLANQARINSDAGRLAINGASATTNVLTGSNSFWIGGSGAMEFNGRIATTAGNMTKDGTGVITLSGNNTYVGVTNVQAGVLRLTNSNALGAGTGVAANATAVYAGGAIELVGGVAIGNEALSFNFLTGGTSVNSGWLRSVSGNNSWGGQITYLANARIQSDFGSTLTIDTPNAEGLIFSGTGDKTMAFGGNGDIIVKDGIGFTAGATGATTFTKDGPGTLTLQGPVSLPGTVNVNINGGKLVLDYANSGTIFGASQSFVFSGSALEAKGSVATPTVTIGGITLTASQGLSRLIAGQNTNLNVSGAWTRGSDAFMLLDISAAGSAITGAPQVVATEGNMIVGTGSGTAAYWTVKDTNGRYDFAALSGGAVTRLNATTALSATTSSTTPTLLTATGGTFTLSGGKTVQTLRVDTSNDLDQTLDLNGSTLTVSKVGMLIDGSGDFTITDSSAGQTGNITQGSTSIFFYHYGTGKFTLDAPAVTGTAGRLFFISDKGSLVDWTAPTTASNTTFLFGATLRLSDPGAMNLTNATSGVGSGFLNIGSGGILELASGDLTRDVGSGAGKIGFTSGDGGGFSAYGADRKVTLNSGSTLAWGSTSGFLANGRKLILGSAHANAVVDLTNKLDLNGGNQTVEVLSENLAGRGGKISGSISGTNGSLTKTGQGILELAGNNTYTGTTQVGQGTLNISGTLNGTNSILVSTNATLQLSGAGTINGGTLTLNNNSKLSLEIGSSSATTIGLNGSVSLFGHIDLALNLIADPIDGLTLTLIDGALALNGYSSGARFFYGGTQLDEGTIFTVSNGSFSQDFSISYLGDGGRDVTLLAVPEPSTAAVLCASVGMLLGLNRFRRRTGLVRSRA